MYSSFTFPNKIQKKLKIHRCVALTFLDNPNGKPTINHIDGVKTNNNLYNLEFATQKEQAVHKVANKLQVNRKGADNEQSFKIYVYDKNLEYIGSFYGCNETGKKFGVPKSTVHFQLSIKNYKKKCKLYFRKEKIKPNVKI